MWLLGRPCEKKTNLKKKLSFSWIFFFWKQLSSGIWVSFFFLVFFSPSNFDFFSEKKTKFPNLFFFISEKKSNLNLVFFSYQFGFFLKKTVSDTYLKCFLQKKSKFLREKDQIQIWFFFWNKKKPNLEIWFFFRKKNPNLKKKKNQEKNLVNSNLVFFTWTDLILHYVCSFFIWNML